MFKTPCSRYIIWELLTNRNLYKPGRCIALKVSSPFWSILPYFVLSLPFASDAYENRCVGRAERDQCLDRSGIINLEGMKIRTYEEADLWWLVWISKTLRPFPVLLCLKSLQDQHYVWCRARLVEKNCFCIIMIIIIMIIMIMIIGII